VTWGFREYVDVYRAAWALNRHLPKGTQPFRILGMNDSPDWSLIGTAADRENTELMDRVFRGCGENLWADVILAAVRSGEKVVVFSGIHHAFTAYRQPVVADGKFVKFARDPRAGNHVFNAIGKRAVTVFLHACRRVRPRPLPARPAKDQGRGLPPRLRRLPAGAVLRRVDLHEADFGIRGCHADPG
jgi:hypothetical protein